MSWEPTQKVFDPRFIGANLIAWFEANQELALAWASANDPPDLPPVLDFFENTRVLTRFPALMINGMSFSTEAEADMDSITISLEYEINIMDGSQDFLATNAPKYAMAFESMVRNIPKTSLQNNSIINFIGVLASLETILDSVKTNGSAFMQTITTSLTWECRF